MQARDETGEEEKEGRTLKSNLSCLGLESTTVDHRGSDASARNSWLTRQHVVRVTGVQKRRILWKTSVGKGRASEDWGREVIVVGGQPRLVELTVPCRARPPTAMSSTTTLVDEQLPRLRTRGRHFIDEQGRVVWLRGANVGAASKVPE